MFSILTNFFKSMVRKKLYLHSNLWYIISFVSQVGDHTFLIILNGHRWSSRSWKTFAMRSQGAPSIVKFAKVEGSSSLPLFKRFSWSLENRKWDRSLRFRRLNQNPERLLSLEYIVPGVPSIYQMDAVRHRFHKAEKRCYCLHFRFRYCHAIVFTFGFDIVMRSHYFTKHTIDIIHKKRDLRIFCFSQTLEFTLMSIKFIKPQLII